MKKYDVVCDCRKPAPGMIIRAINEYNLPKDQVFLFGDSDRDIKAAEAAGIKGFLFDGTNLKDFVYQKLAGLGYRDNKRISLYFRLIHEKKNSFVHEAIERRFLYNSLLLHRFDL